MIYTYPYKKTNLISLFLNMIETVGVEFVGTHHRAAQAGAVSEQALYVVCASAAVIAVGGRTRCRPPPHIVRN